VSTFEQNIKSIFNDRINGASVIEANIVKMFLAAYRGGELPGLKSIKKHTGLLKDRFGLMANVLSLLIGIESNAKLKPEQFGEFLRCYKSASDQSKALTIDKTSKLISNYKSIFTLSNSGIIRNSIMRAHKSGWPGRVNIIKSGPHDEGALLARNLAKNGIEVALSGDTLIYDQIKKSGAVFLGADAITESYFVNKIGSKLAVLIAGELSKKVYVAAEKTKYISNKRYKFRPDTNPPDEILKTNNCIITITNSYFERILPIGKIYFVNCSKLLKPRDIRFYLKQLG